MNEAELIAAAKLRRKGWSVIATGWPDLLCVRNSEVRAVEVKTGDAPVMPNQRKMHRALRRAGIPVSVVRVAGAVRWRFHPTPSDQHLIDALHAKLSLTPVEILMLSVRALAEKEGLSA